MDGLFKKTLKDIDTYSPVFRKIGELAVELGLDPKHLSVYHAFMKVETAVKQKIELDNKSRDLGYSSAFMALKALSQLKNKDIIVDLSQLPEVFHKVPSIWLDGKPNRGNQKGFVRLTVAQAERAHRVIAPLLVESWQLASGDEKIRDQITREYLSTSSQDFESALYKYIYDLEEVSLEEELERWDNGSSNRELEMSLRITERGDYGVGGKMDDVDWDEDNDS